MLPIRGAVLSGRILAQAICHAVESEVALLKTEYNIFPKLTVIEVGHREDSALYVECKRKFAAKCGIELAHIRLSSDCTESSLINLIQQYNEDPTCHGIMIQLPLDSSHAIDVTRPLHAIMAEKDVEGLGFLNTALLSREDVLCSICGGLKLRAHIPCTAAACFAFIRHVQFPLKGSRCLVVGRGRLVGAPTADLLAGPGRATVTQCHVFSRNLAEEVARSDLIVAGIGHPELIRGEWIKPGALILDCGYSVVPDPADPNKMRSVGDVHFNEARSRGAWITPVPGGIGPVNIAMLFRNTVNSARWSAGLSSATCECPSSSSCSQERRASDGMYYCLYRSSQNDPIRS